MPLDVTVVLPEGELRRRPLVAAIHGFGNSKEEYLDPESEAYTGNAWGWAKRGYAVLTYTARGLWGSCGTPEARLASPVECARGYIHLADTRYEVRDAQHLIGLLVDEGIADPKRIGATGDSYGGGQTLALAALRDRVMLPDGSYEPWRSPAGTPLRLRAAAPVIPWTDLVGAIAPNGRTRSAGVTPDAAVAEPVGVFKLSVANAILAAAQTATGPGQPVGQPFVPGRPEGYLSPPGLDPQADVTSWVARADAGEPYDDAEIREVIAMMRRFHSAYGVDTGRAPPPLFVGTGFTDDLFPADETLRFVNRLRAQRPKLPVSVYLGDYGHQRAANKPADRARLLRMIRRWFAFHLRGRGRRPATGFVATSQTCPRDQPSEGPFRARSFAGLSRRVVRFAADPPQSISSGGGDPQVAAAIDPVTGGGDGCVTTSSAAESGTASYELPAAGPAGWMLAGSPKVSLRLDVTGTAPETAQLAARLWDVAPDGTQRLVARGSYRPRGGPRDWFELHPAAWRFAEGHVPKLQLLGRDAPYARPSNAAFTVVASDLRLRLPAR